MEEKKVQPATVDDPSVVIAGVPLYDDGGRDRARFVVGGYKDVWAAVLFLTMTVVMGILCSIGIPRAASAATPPHAATYAPQPPVTVEPRSPITGGQVATIAIAGITILGGVAMGLLALLAALPKESIIACNAAVGILLVIVGISTKDIVGAVIFVVMGVGVWVWLYLVRDRIAISAMLLRISTNLLKQYKSIVLVSVVVLLIAAVHFTICAGAALFFFTYMDLKSNENDGAIAGILFVVFFMFWSTQVAAGIVQTTSMGVAATWYFCGGSMPSNPTLKSFKRSTTTSVGSICFGALFVAVVRFIRFLMERLTRHEGFVAHLANCLMSFIQYLVERFNEYAYAHIAIYGCGYLDAARQTWELTKNCGATVLLTDILVSYTLSIATLAGSLSYGMIWGLWYGDVGVGVTASILALLVLMVVLRPIRSHLTALLVCYAEVPAALQQTSPELFEKVVATDRNEASA